SPTLLNAVGEGSGTASCACPSANAVKKVTIRATTQVLEALRRAGRFPSVPVMSKNSPRPRPPGLGSTLRGSMSKSLPMLYFAGPSQLLLAFIIIGCRQFIGDRFGTRRKIFPASFVCRYWQRRPGTSAVRHRSRGRMWGDRIGRDIALGAFRRGHVAHH